MNAPFSDADRRRGHEAMTKQLTPAARVRRRFLQGRTAKRDVLLSPLSAIAAAVEALTEVLGYIAEKEPTLLPADNVAVWVVCLSSVREVARRVYPEDREGIRALLDELTALPDFGCLGLTVIVREMVDGDWCPVGWVRPFVWDSDSLTILGVVLEKQIRKFGKGLTD
jgi:hypothetical protein